MAGLVPAIYVYPVAGPRDVDARDKPGHDDVIRPVGYTHPAFLCLAAE